MRAKKLRILSRKSDLAIIQAESVGELLKENVKGEDITYLHKETLGDIDQNIRLKRLETPRVKVPKGSVGITEKFCNIYTFESPGGWNIIGNTPLKVFNKFNDINPALINPGDTVSFYKITKEEYNNWNDK